MFILLAYRVVIRQADKPIGPTGPHTVLAIGVATVIRSMSGYFYCFIEGDGGDSTRLQWQAKDDFTTISRRFVNNSEVLSFVSMRPDQKGHYICRDTAQGTDTVLEITTGNDQY